MSKPWWGLRAPEWVQVAWGARAIFEIYGGAHFLDFLWDRQSWRGAPDQALVDWFNATGRDALTARLRDLDVQTSDAITVVVEQDGYTIHASPRRSYGYLYVVVFETPEPEDEGQAPWTCEAEGCTERAAVLTHDQHYRCTAHRNEASA